MEMTQTEVTTSDGVPLRVWTAGPAGAPVTVVLLHGWTCSARSWHHQFDDLPGVLGADRVRLVAYDHRGHGRSGPAPRGTTRIDQLADDLVTVLDAVVPAGPVVAAGHSMGGMTLMALADRRPDLFGTRITGVALVSTSSGRTTSQAFGLPARLDTAAAVVAPRAVNLAAAAADRGASRQEVFPRSARRRTDARRVGGTPPVEMPAARRSPRALRHLVFGPHADPAEVEIFLSDLGVLPGRSLSGFFEAIAAHDLGHALPVLDQIPVEVMHGARDRLLPPRHGERLAELIPSARLWRYPGAGHMLMQERPRDITHRLAGLARHALA